MKSFKTSAVLLSRQPLRPCRQTPWIQKAIEAVHWIKENRSALVTSLGMQTWEFLVYLAQSSQTEQIMLIPATSKSDFEKRREHALDQFNLDPELVRFKAVISKDSNTCSRNLPKTRDDSVISEADILLPVSIRPGGYMESLVNRKTAENPFMVNRQFQTDYPRKKHAIAYKIDKNRLLPEIIQMENHYLIHWTRTSNGPWPDEKKYQYFADIRKNDIYPRNAFHTLRHILKTQKIMASYLHKPKSVPPTVSFSGLAPHRAIPLMKWRSRYRQMSFEPYGIGIEKSEAERLGISPVYYYHKGENTKNRQPWCLQSVGTKTNWQRELEYRYPGDLDLSNIACHKMACFCFTKKETRLIEKMFGIKTYAFCSRLSEN